MVNATSSRGLYAAVCCSMLQYAAVRCGLPLSVGLVHLRARPEEVVLAQSIRVNICPVLITQALITLALVIVAAVGAFAPRLPHALHGSTGTPANQSAKGARQANVSSVPLPLALSLTTGWQSAQQRRMLGALAASRDHRGWAGAALGELLQGRVGDRAPSRGGLSSAARCCTHEPPC